MPLVSSNPRLFPAIEKDGQGKLINDFAVGLSQAAKEKRESIDTRLKKRVEIVNDNPDEHFILWHDLESDGKWHYWENGCTD